MQIRESAEDYLEAILVLSRKGGGVRSVDIATMLGVSRHYFLKSRILQISLPPKFQFFMPVSCPVVLPIPCRSLDRKI